MNQRLEALLEDLQRVDSLDTVARAKCLRRANWLTEGTPPEQADFMVAVEGLPLPLSEPQDTLLRASLAQLVKQRLAEQVGSAPASPALLAERASLAQTIARLYRHLGPKSASRGPLLAWLAVGGSAAEVGLLVQLLVEDPPVADADVVQALSPLFQHKNLPWTSIFPELLAALPQPSLAASVLDLANYATRKKFVAQHPAQDRQAELINYLSALTGKLAGLERHGGTSTASPLEWGRQIAQSVALGVSLCHALSLLNAKEATGKLFQMMELGHRRLRTEAAAALAHLGEKAGGEELVRMAAEPVARLRVLAYAKELKLLDQIDEKYQTPAARAEAELTVWLAEPTQYGVPPAQCELVDQRQQFWPGYAQARECFLFRFTYLVTIEGEGERSYSNIGIAGPLAHAFTADLADLPPDDIYATYAGWQTEHEEIREYEVQRLSRSEQIEVARLERRLHDAGYDAIVPQIMGYFFGEKALVAQVERSGLPGLAVADFQDILFLPTRHQRRPLGAREVYSLYKGRKLLKTFNRPE